MSISRQALLYLGLRHWDSTRELEQHLASISLAANIELQDVVADVEKIYAVEAQTGVKILSEEDYGIELTL